MGTLIYYTCREPRHLAAPSRMGLGGIVFRHGTAAYCDGIGVVLPDLARADDRVGKVRCLCWAASQIQGTTMRTHALVALALALFPEQMLSGFGLGVPKEAQVLSRDVGVTLIGLGIINWLARNEMGPAVRALLIGNAFIQIAELVVNGWEVAAGILPGQAAGGLVLHLVLAVIFLLPLRRA